MKNLFLLFGFLSLSTFAFSQNIWTVNNQPNSSANFTTIQAANDSAIAGDIIMVQGSTINYGSPTITKQLVIIGPGYFLGQNENPYTQANALRAYAHHLTISTGASGTIVTGMTLNFFEIEGNIIDVTAQRCRINQFFTEGLPSATFKECFIGNTAATPISHGFANAAIITYEDNIIVSSGSFIIYGYNTTYNHNLFIGLNTSSNYTFGNVSGCVFTDNLILADQDVVYSNTPTVRLNNMTNTDLFEGVTSNTANVNADDVIIGWADATGLSPDFRYTLKDDSPAIDAASDGTNIGPFQDDGGYVLSGIPFVPNIYAITAPDFGTNGSGITINIKAKANN